MKSLLLIAQCTGFLDQSTATGKMLHDAYNIMKFAVPFLLIGLAIADYGKALLAQDQKAVNSATSKFGKRIVIAIILLVLPTILNFILKIIDPNICPF